MPSSFSQIWWSSYNHDLCALYTLNEYHYISAVTELWAARMHTHTKSNWSPDLVIQHQGKAGLWKALSYPGWALNDDEAEGVGSGCLGQKSTHQLTGVWTMGRGGWGEQEGRNAKTPGRGLPRWRGLRRNLEAMRDLSKEPTMVFYFCFFVLPVQLLPSLSQIPLLPVEWYYNKARASVCVCVCRLLTLWKSII